MKYLGVDVRKLPDVEISDDIKQHNMVDVSTRDIKRVNFHLICRNTKYVITASHFRKTKRTELEFRK